MAFTSLIDSDSTTEPLLATINTTPLVDVMLVLLIIFLITIPVVIHTVPVQLPQHDNPVERIHPHTIHLTVSRSEQVYLEQNPVELAALQKFLLDSADGKERPTVQVRADREATYAPIQRIIQVCRASGYTQLRFVTDPGRPQP